MNRGERNWKRWPLWVVVGLIGAWLTAPSLVVIPLSFTGKPSLVFPPTTWSTRWYANFFTDPKWVNSLINSLQIGVLVAVIATVLGTAAAFALNRMNSRLVPALRSLMLAPVVIPAIILAIGIYVLYLQWGLTGTIGGFVAAHTVLALPFVIIPVSASLQTFDRQLERAAQNLGARPWTVFRTVTLPVILPGVVSGALFAFVTSFDEVVIALFIQDPYVQTLPVQMYKSITNDADPTIAAAATMILLVTTMVIVAAGGLALRQSKKVHT